MANIHGVQTSTKLYFSYNVFHYEYLIHPLLPLYNIRGGGCSELYMIKNWN